MYRFALAVSCMAIGVTMLGCGGENVNTVPVAGVVTYNGSPVEGADVAFHPKSETGRVASGKTDSQGQFTLTTYVSPDQQELGAVPGEYAIAVTKTEVSGGPMSPEEMATQMQGSSSNSAPQLVDASSKLPERYATPTKSPLSETVPDGGVLELKLELTDGSK